MGAGLIYFALAVVWLVFLVPWFVSRNQSVEVDDVDVTERFSRAMTVIQRSEHWVDEATEYAVSTPLTRRAERYEIAQTAKRAAARRRRVMVALVLLTLAAAVAAPFTAVTWWQACVPAVGLLAFCAVARVSVRGLNARLDERLAAIDVDWCEDTIVFEMPKDETEATEMSIELSAPITGFQGSLWDPIPVTQPTYLAKPLVPRTVRTIDLSAPEPTVSVPRMPVVAEPLPGLEKPSDEGTQGERRVG